MRGRIALLTLMVALTASCFGYSVEKTSDPARAMVVNLGANRYIYTVVRTRNLRAIASVATPVVSVAPNVAEAGIITVKVEHSGWGYEGLRRTESEFYSELAPLTAEIGGQYFHVADKTVSQGFIEAMTVSVLVPNAPPPNPALNPTGLRPAG
jgi:hypothetical protein